MNKKHYLILVFFSIVAIYACRKEFSSSEEPASTTFTVEQAKAYLHKELNINSEKIVLNAPATISKLNLVMGDAGIQRNRITGSVYWEKAKTYKMDNYDVVEVPFLSQNNFVSVYGFGINDHLISNESLTRQAMASYTSLLVYRKSNTILDRAFVTYIPDVGYLESSIFETDEMSINNIPEAFSGYLEYKNWEQKVLFVLRVDAGEVVKRYSIGSNYLNGNGSSLANKMDDSSLEANNNYQATSSCQTVCTPIYQTICVDPMEGFDGPPVCSTQQIGQNCHQVCDGGGSPNDPPNPGGGGGGPSNPNPVSLAETRALINNVFDKCPNFGTNTEANQKFESEMHELLNRDGFSCMTKSMLTILSNSSGTGKIQLCIANDVTMGTYNAADKSIRFGSVSQILKPTIFHEIFHAVQDKTYQNGIGQYSIMGKPDIEFETHFFIDLVGRVVNEQPISVSLEHINAFKSFLNELVVDNNGNRNLSQAKMFFNDPEVRFNPNYLHYFSKFREKFTIHGGDDKVKNLNPVTIKYLLENTPCVTPGN